MSNAEAKWILPLFAPLFLGMFAFLYFLSPFWIPFLTVVTAIRYFQGSSHHGGLRWAVTFGLLIVVPLTLIGLLAPVHWCLVLAFPPFVHPILRAPVTLSVGICGALLGIIGLLLVAAIRRDRRALRRLNTTPIAKVVPGLSEFEGVVRLLPDVEAPRTLEHYGRGAGALGNPPDDAVVAWTNGAIPIQEPRYHLRQVSEVLRRRFLVEDDTGSIVIDPGQARVSSSGFTMYWDRRGQMILTKHAFRTGGGFPETGTLLRAGDRVHVLGWAEALQGVSQEGALPVATLMVRAGGAEPLGGDRRIVPRSFTTNLPELFAYAAGTFASFFQRRGPSLLFLVSDSPEAKLDQHLRRAQLWTALLALIWIVVPALLIGKGIADGRRTGWSLGVTNQGLGGAIGRSSDRHGSPARRALVNPPTIYFPPIVHELIPIEPMECETKVALDAGACFFTCSITRSFTYGMNSLGP